ncbi:SH3 domain-containing protein [Peribacillus sp. SI8-4]|uniref:SH3 domain-containing protein n=1 Tax=Peribacillus sp. SI8-4 TaxID=3048009 RepID=UPI0025525BE0|nr:SH3 domain-containing protein [Peribacillus sp. SI8-4]
MKIEMPLVVDGKLVVSRKDKHGNHKEVKINAKEITPVFTTRMETRQYNKATNNLDIRNVLDIKAFLRNITRDWRTHVSNVRKWVKMSPAKTIIVSGIFTILLTLSAQTASACIDEYTYVVKDTDTIETISNKHGVTPEQIKEANGIASIKSHQKLLLPSVKDAYVTATSLNVRSSPSTSSSIVGSYKKGDTVKLIHVKNGWAEIIIEGRVVFVNAAYISESKSTDQADPAPSVQAKTMYVHASSLRVRAAASATGSILGSLKQNSKVTVVSTTNGWAQITYHGKKAYVSESYLTAKPQTSKQENPSHASEYVIKSGDTFTKISKRLGIPVAVIQEANPKVDSTKLTIGQTIKIPVVSPPTQTNTTINVKGMVTGVDSTGVFRFIANDGVTYSARATSDSLKNELFSVQGTEVELTLDSKRGKQMTLIAIRSIN